MSKPVKTIICDLDGTLADVEHRRHFIQRPKGQKDWKSFYRSCVSDTLKSTVWYVVRSVMDSLEIDYDVEFVIFSGRTEVMRPETEDWLAEHGIIYDLLVMRPAKDNTPDEVLKEKWFNEMIDKETVFCVFDDRSKVVEMWRRIGLTCFQVANGDF